MYKSISALFVGNSTAQLILFLSQPLLAYIYEPSSFGVLAQVTSVGNVLIVFSCLQLHTALVLPKNKEDSIDLFAIGLLWASIFFVFLNIVLFFTKGLVFGSESQLVLVVITGLFVFMTSNAYLFRGWQTYQSNFLTLSIIAPLRALLIVFGQLLFGFYGSHVGLVLGVVLGEFVWLCLLLVTDYTPPIYRVLSVWSLKKLKECVASYREFTFTGTVQEVVSVSAFTVPLYMFARMYDMDIGGQYAMANKLVWAPVTLIGASVSQVVYKEMSVINHSELRNSPLLKFKIVNFSILIAGIISAFLAPLVLNFLLPDEWLIASKMSFWIAIWGAFFLVSIPFRICYRVLKLQRIQLLIDIFVLMIFLSVFLFFKFSSPIKALSFVTVTAVIQNLFLILYMYYKVNNKVDNYSLKT